jgi:monofunctional biosynthetic peptidoglycan transglycosylase
MPKTNSKKNSIFKKALRIVAILWLSSLAYVILCKWMMPPITVTQIVDVFSGYGLKRDYVSWDEMSPNIKLAAIASEDQRFTDHGGFDWKSIDKSMNSKKKKKKAVESYFGV